MALLPLGALILLQAGGPEATAVRKPYQANPHSLPDIALELFTTRRLVLVLTKRAQVDAELVARYPESATLREQQRVPTALRAVLPPGLQGALATAMLGFFISTREPTTPQPVMAYILSVLVVVAQTRHTCTPGAASSSRTC